MAHETSKVTGFAIDNSAGALTNISGSTNSVVPTRGFEELDDTGLGDNIHTRVPGLGMAAVYDANGFVNSTTRAIFAPLLHGTAATVTKTIELKIATGEYWTGEAVVTNVSMPVNVGQINTWSCTLTAATGLTDTSVTAAT